MKIFIIIIIVLGLTSKCNSLLVNKTTKVEIEVQKILSKSDLESELGIILDKEMPNDSFYFLFRIENLTQDQLFLEVSDSKLLRISMIESVSVVDPIDHETSLNSWYQNKNTAVINPSEIECFYYYFSLPAEYHQRMIYFYFDIFSDKELSVLVDEVIVPFKLE